MSRHFPFAVGIALMAALQAGCERAVTAELDAVGTASPLATVVKLDTNDVSILVPLPIHAADPAFLKPSQAPSLLSFEKFSAFLATSAWTPVLAEPLDTPALQREIYNSLQVLSVRVDPCFPGFNPGEAECRPQIRVVVQSVTEQPSQETAHQVKTGDATLHLFYELSASAFQKVLAELRRLKAQAPALTAGIPLGIHPRLSREGVHGAFAGDLRALLRASCNETNLSRIAFMQLEFGPFSNFPNQWAFGAANHVGNVFESAKLAHLSEESTVQTFIMRHKTVPAPDTQPPIVDRDSLDGRLLPEGAGADGVDFFLRSDNYLGKPTQLAVKDAMKALLRVENPHFNGPNSVDCASCHIATPLRLFAERHQVSTGDTAYDEVRFKPTPGGANAELRTKQASSNPEREMYTTVNFGYFDLAPSIAQRTVNESAEVANALNGMP